MFYFLQRYISNVEIIKNIFLYLSFLLCVIFVARSIIVKGYCKNIIYDDDRNDSKSIDIYLLINCILSVGVIIGVTYFNIGGKVMKIITNVIYLLIIALTMLTYSSDIVRLFNISLFMVNKRIVKKDNKDIVAMVFYSNYFLIFCDLYIELDDLIFGLYSLSTRLKALDDLLKILIMIVYLTFFVFWLFINVYSILVSIYDICYNSNVTRNFIKKVEHFKMKHLSLFLIRDYLVEKEYINKKIRVVHLLLILIDIPLFIISLSINVIVIITNMFLSFVNNITLEIIERIRSKNEYQLLYSLLRLSIIISSLLTTILFLYYINNQLSVQGYELLNVLVGVIVIPTVIMQLQENSKTKIKH